MKTIFTLLFILCFSIAKADNPFITLEYKYSKSTDTLHFENMKLDNNFCCNFQIINTASDSTGSDIVLLRHTETGVVLGKIYGKPSKEFILEICRRYGYLDKSNVDNLAYRISNNKKYSE